MHKGNYNRGDSTHLDGIPMSPFHPLCKPFHWWPKWPVLHTWYPSLSQFQMLAGLLLNYIWTSWLVETTARPSQLQPHSNLALLLLAHFSDVLTTLELLQWIFWDVLILFFFWAQCLQLIFQSHGFLSSGSLEVPLFLFQNSTTLSMYIINSSLDHVVVFYFISFFAPLSMLATFSLETERSSDSPWTGCLLHFLDCPWSSLLLIALST